jgi:hypothetical protein
MREPNSGAIKGIEKRWKMGPKKAPAPEEYTETRTFFAPSQQRRFFLRITPEKNWQIAGIPASQKASGDEVLESQLEWFQILQQHGLHDFGIEDFLFNGPEKLIGKALNSFLNLVRKPPSWKRWGVYNQDGEAIEEGYISE